MNTRLIIVDDDEKALSGYRRALRPKYNITVESSPDRALELIKSDGPFAAVLSDYKMPSMDGVTFLSEVRKWAPDSVRLMVTGFADLEKTIKAVNEGNIFRIFTKPCPLPELNRGLDDALRQYQLVVAERELLDSTLTGSVQTLLELLSILNPQAFAFAKKRRMLAKSTAESLGVNDLWGIEMAAMLCEIGIVSWPDEVVRCYRSGNPLNVAQRELVKQLPSISAKLLEKIPRLEAVREIIGQQLLDFAPACKTRSIASRPTGTCIRIEARILKVINDFLLLEERGQLPDQALEILAHAKDSYDSEIVATVKKVIMDATARHPEDRKAKPMMLANLIEGYVLRSDVRALSGDLILRSGQTLGQIHIQRLRNFACSVGIQEPFLVEAQVSRN